MTRTSVGIVGQGWVGGILTRYFEEIAGHTRGENLHAYDLDSRRSFGDLSEAAVVFICVPTPRDPETGACVIQQVEEAVDHLDGSRIVVIKSTVPPGTTENLQRKYPRHQLLFNPEFLTESRAWEDMVRPDRQIVGFTERSLESAHQVLSLLPKAPFMSPGGIGTYQPVRLTATEAELVKYAGNVFFFLKVVYANGLFDAASALKVSYENVRGGMSADYRIGGSHLDAHQGGYRGAAGYCLLKDTAAFMNIVSDLHCPEVRDFIRGAWEYNRRLLLGQGYKLSDVEKHVNEIHLCRDSAPSS